MLNVNHPIQIQYKLNGRIASAIMCCRPGFDQDSMYCLDRIEDDNVYYPIFKEIAFDIVNTQPMQQSVDALIQTGGIIKGLLYVLVGNNRMKIADNFTLNRF